MAAECENDERDVAGPDESLCAVCLEHERRGVGLSNYRLHAYRRAGRAQTFDLLTQQITDAVQARGKRPPEPPH